MGPVVVDTSVLIDHLRGDMRARTALSRAVEHGDTLLASVVTKVEILAGMRPNAEATTWRLLTSLRRVAVSEELAERAGDGVLWTRNVTHFPMFAGLRAPY